MYGTRNIKHKNTKLNSYVPYIFKTYLGTIKLHTFDSTISLGSEFRGKMQMSSGKIIITKKIGFLLIARITFMR